MSDNTIGFSIQITGTDSSVQALGNVKRELIDAQAALSKLTDATKDNIGAQKASAVQQAALEAQVKALRSEYNAQQKAIIETATSVDAAAGSYDALTQENSKLSAQLRALPIDETNIQFKSLQAQMLENTNKLKEFDTAIGRNQRNVGDYPNELKLAGNSVRTFSGILEGLSRALGVQSEALIEINSLGKETARLGREIAETRILEKEGAIQVTTAVEGEAVAHKANTETVETETIAQQALNLVKEAGVAGVALIIAGIVAVGAAIYGLIQGYKDEQKAMELRNTAVDGTVFANKELKDSYNDAIVKITEVNNAWKVHIGVLSEAGAALDNLRVKNLNTLEDIKNDTDAKLLEVKSDWYKYFLNTAGADQIEQRAKIIADGNAKIKAEELKSAAERYKIKEDQMAKDGDEAEKAIEEVAKKDEEARKVAHNKLETLIKENAAKILKLTADLQGGQFELMKQGTEKDFAQIEDKYDKEIILVQANIVKKKDLTAQEIELNRLANERIVQLEKSKEQALKQLGDAALKSENEIQLKRNDLKLAIEEEGIKDQLEVAKNAIVDSDQLQKDKNDQIEKLEHASAEQLLTIQKRYAEDKIDLLKKQYATSTDEEKKQITLQIAKLQTFLDSEVKPLPHKSPLAKMFGTDADNAKLVIDDALTIAKQVSDALFTAEQNHNKRMLDQQITFLTAQNDTQQALLSNRLKNGLITETQFAQEKDQQDKIFAKKEEDAKRAEFEKDKTLKKKQIGVELALELVKIAAAYASIPYVGWATSVIQGAAAVASAGIQVAAIDAETYEDGGVVTGPSHDDGGIPFTVNGTPGFEMEGDEIILTKGVNRDPYLRSLASEINVAGGGRHFAAGGPVPIMPKTSALTTFDEEGFINRLSGSLASKINAKKVYNVESDSTAVQKKVQQYEDERTF